LAVGGFGEEFVRLNETALLVGNEVSNAFYGLANSLVDSMGLAENGMEGFLGSILKVVAQIISAMLGQAIAAAIAGANIASIFYRPPPPYLHNRHLWPQWLVAF
jgi:hypothetical protein